MKKMLYWVNMLNVFLTLIKITKSHTRRIFFSKLHLCSLSSSHHYHHHHHHDCSLSHLHFLCASVLSTPLEWLIVLWSAALSYHDLISCTLNKNGGGHCKWITSCFWQSHSKCGPITFQFTNIKVMVCAVSTLNSLHKMYSLHIYSQYIITC